MNCAGFQSALNVAHDMIIADSKIKNIAVVGVAKQSPYLNPDDPNTAYFFSDGAACVIIEASNSIGYRPGICRVKTNNLEAVRLRGGGASYRKLEPDSKAAYYEHAGMAVWKETVVQIPSIAKETAELYGWALDEIDFVLMHQANLRLIEYLMARMRLTMESTVTTVEDMGNTAEASLGTVIDKAFDLGLFNKPCKVLLLSVGAGFIYETGTYEVS